ncbi:MAG TPA: hypothetical protein VIK59_05620 [Verrucomicrobiae bacterium]
MAGEIITSSGLAAAVGVKLIYDVCGPTAKYAGGELASYAEIGVKNLKRVFENAAKQLKAQNKIGGQVPPRVLKEILSEGYFCEDELQAMYLGGVLASSKGSISRDDRAIAYCSLVNSLSSYQLRTHCIIYSALLRIKHYHLGKNLLPIEDIVSRWIQKHGLTVIIRESDYQSAMEFSAEEHPSNIAQHSFVGLEKKGLSERGIHVCHSRNPNNPKDGEVPFRYFYPTMLGVELFLWGQGVGDCGLEAYRSDLLQKIELPFNVEPYEVHPGQCGF